MASRSSVTDRLGPLVATGSMSLTDDRLHIVLVVGVFVLGIAPLGWSVGTQEAIFVALVGLMALSNVGFARWNRVGSAERIMKRVATPSR